MQYPKALIKFGKKKHLKKLIDGYVRFAPLGYYKHMESSSDKKAREDNREGVITVVNIKNAKRVPRGADGEYDMTKAEALNVNKLSYVVDGVENTPILCFSIYEDIEFLNGTVIIDKSWLFKSIADFEGTDAILIIKNPQNFIDELQTKINEKLYHHNIIYQDFEDEVFNRFLDEKEHGSIHIPGAMHSDNHHKTIFQKTTDFEYQNEYRLCILEKTIINPIVIQSTIINDYILVDLNDIDKIIRDK